MTSQNRLLDSLRGFPVLPVLREASAESAFAHSTALLSAGLPHVELTATTPDWTAVLERTVALYPDALVGVGTIPDAAAVEQAASRGAAFLVTPWLAPDVRSAAEACPFALTALRDTPVREWDDVLDTNLRAAWLLSCLAAPSMQAAGWGRIVNVSAGSGYVRNHSVYGLAKGALNLLTEQLAIELGPAVTVNAVAPGQIAESADVIAEYDSEFVDRFIAQSPLGRLVRRDEVADLGA